MRDLDEIVERHRRPTPHPKPEWAVGEVWESTGPVDRYPHFLLDAGVRGVVTHVAEWMVVLYPDDPVHRDDVWDGYGKGACPEDRAFGSSIQIMPEDEEDDWKFVGWQRQCSECGETFRTNEPGKRECSTHCWGLFKGKP